MTLQQWTTSDLGRPPRLNPFHLCRSVLIGGLPEWWDEVPESDLAPLPKVGSESFQLKSPGKLKAEAAAGEAAKRALTFKPVDKAAEKVKKAAGEFTDTILSAGEIVNAGVWTPAAEVSLEGLKQKAKGLAVSAQQPLAAVDKAITAIDMDWSKVKAKAITQLSDELGAEPDNLKKLKKLDDMKGLGLINDQTIGVLSNNIKKNIADELKAKSSKLTKDLLIKEVNESKTVNETLGLMDDAADVDLYPGLLAADIAEVHAAAGVKIKGIVSASEKHAATFLDLAKHVDAPEKIQTIIEQIPTFPGILEQHKSGLLSELVAIHNKALAANIETPADLAAGLLKQISAGTLGPKKLKTITKQYFAKAKEAGFGDDFTAAMLKGAQQKFTDDFTAEQIHFWREYNALVTSKQVTPAQAAEALLKVKAGKLPGKAGAKAKEALAKVQAKLAAEAQDLAQQAAGAVVEVVDDIDLNDFGIIDQAFAVMKADADNFFTLKGDAKHLGGAHAKQLYADPDGDEWLFKPGRSDAPFVVHGEEAAYKIQRAVDPSTPEVRAITVNGQFGSIQRLAKDVKGDLAGVDVNSLSPEVLAQIQREHVVDWATSNHDGHGGQFIINGDGHIFGIDKGQAFKHWDTDELSRDYHPNSFYGETEPIYNTIAKAVKAGEMVDLDPIHHLDAIRKLEAIPDAEYREYLRAYAEGRYSSAGGASDFLDAMVTRKNNLRGDFEKWYREMTGDASFAFQDSAPPAPGIAPARVIVSSPGAEAVLAEAERHGWQGKAIDYDGGDVEDQSLLTFVERLNDKPTTVSELKVSAAAGKKIEKWLSQFNVQGSAPTIAKAGDFLTEDDYWPDILNAIKTVNQHKTDLQYNYGNLGKAQQYQIDLKHLILKADVDPEVKAMAEYYQKVIQDIMDAEKANIGTANYTRYTRKTNEAPPAIAPKTSAAHVTKSDLQFRQRHIDDDGRLIVDDDATASLMQVFPRTHITGTQYNIEMPDGVKVVFRPKGNNPKSYWNHIEVYQDGLPSPQSLEKLTRTLDEMGIDARVSTPDDLELMYLKRMADTLQEGQEDGYRAVSTAVSRKKPADQIIAYRKYWSNKLGVDDVTKLPQYQPGGRYETSYRDYAKGGKTQAEAGNRYFSRFDIAEADVPEGFNLYHSTSSLGQDSDDGIIRFFKEFQVAQKNMKLVSTREKVRLGLVGRTASPDWDLNKGGGSYGYLRSLQNKDWVGLYFKSRNFLRMDARHHQGDETGSIDGKVRATKIDKDSLRQWSGGSSNEILFKDGMSLFDELDKIVLQTNDSRNELLKIFKDAGIDSFPDGRKIEDIVIAKGSPW